MGLIRRQQEPQDVPDTNVGDTISRQAAIDAVHKSILDFFDICDDDEESPMTYKDERLLELNKAITTRIKATPSAQSDIIRCKDCKHWMPYDWMFSEVWRSVSKDDYSDDEIGCAYCDMSMGAMDYCSRGERKDD